MFDLLLPLASTIPGAALGFLCHLQVDYGSGCSLHPHILEFFFLSSLEAFIFSQFCINLEIYDDLHI